MALLAATAIFFSWPAFAEEVVPGGQHKLVDFYVDGVCMVIEGGSPIHPDQKLGENKLLCKRDLDGWRYDCALGDRFIMLSLFPLNGKKSLPFDAVVYAETDDFVSGGLYHVDSCRHHFRRNGK